MERRNQLESLELRSDGDGRRLEGYALRFYDGTPATEFRMKTGIVERIAPGAVDIDQKRRILALYNHDLSKVLGAHPGSLQLGVDSRGLFYSLELPDTETGREVRTLIDRGDVNGSSFGFNVVRQQFVREGRDRVRSIEAVEITDVGPTILPAYEGATAALRSEDPIDAVGIERAFWRADVTRRLLDIKNHDDLA